MKRFLRVIMWLLFIVALAIAGAYFLPRVVVVERSAVIEAPVRVVFAQVNDLHSWDKWSKWNQIDPEMKVEYINNGVGNQAGYIWESDNKKVGSGKLLITESAPYDSIVTLLNFAEQGDARGIFYFDENTDSTALVRWKLSFDVGFNPAARWMGLMMDKFVGPDFEEGLQNLNLITKVQVEEKSLVEELVTIGAFNYASVRQEVPFMEVSLVMGEMYAEVSTFIENEEIGIAGAPFAIYHEMEGEKIDLECGVPVSENIAGSGLVNAATFGETQCATVDYFGDYRQLEDAHTELQAWIEQHRFKLAGAPIEFYLTDPATEPDVQKWHTRICYPVIQYPGN
ncbi:MAG TPA: GyrI-like domain-containing protein [Prolixibacteraceae bacterium]|nr:GyrI-like domain-containing protein [Prolixibacteraceae bacterium]